MMRLTSRHELCWSQLHESGPSRISMPSISACPIKYSGVGSSIPILVSSFANSSILKDPPLSVASCMARRILDRVVFEVEPIFSRIFSLELILEVISLVSSFGRFAFDTAPASSLGLSKTESSLNRIDPHLVQRPETPALDPKAFPQTHLSSCQSLSMNIPNNAGSSPCRGKDEHLEPPKNA